MQTMHVITWTNENASTGSAVLNCREKRLGHVSLELPADPEVAIEGDPDGNNIINKKLYISFYNTNGGSFYSRAEDYQGMRDRVAVYELMVTDENIRKIHRALSEDFFGNYKMQQELQNADLFGHEGCFNHVRPLLRPAATSKIKYKAEIRMNDQAKSPRKENCTSLVYGLLQKIDCELGVAVALDRVRYLRYFLLVIALLDSIGFGYSAGDTVRAGISSDENHTALPWWLIIPPVVPFAVGVGLIFARMCYSTDDTALLLGQYFLIASIVLQLIVTAVAAALEGVSKVSKTFTDASSGTALGIGIVCGVIFGIFDFCILRKQILAPFIHRPKDFDQRLSNAAQAGSLKNGSAIKKLDEKETINFFQSWFVEQSENKIKTKFGINRPNQERENSFSDRRESDIEGYIELPSSENRNHNPLQFSRNS